MDKRHHSRVSMGSECRAQFQVAGEPHQIVAVCDLGPNGCRIKVPVQAGALLNAMPRFDRLELIHPALPKGSLQARVVWCHDQGLPDSGFVESGVQFLHVPRDYQQKLSDYVVFLEPPSTCDH